MTIRHWKLAGAEDDRLFSPHCWRVRMAQALFVKHWRERMLDLLDGMPRQTRGYPVWA